VQTGKAPLCQNANIFRLLSRKNLGIRQDFAWRKGAAAPQSPLVISIVIANRSPRRIRCSITIAITTAMWVSRAVIVPRNLNRDRRSSCSRLRPPITTAMVHRQQIVDRAALSAYARRPVGRVGRLRRLGGAPDTAPSPTAACPSGSEDFALHDGS